MPAGDDRLDAWIAERLGEAVVDRSPVGGGCIHEAWCLRLAGGDRLFAKTNRADAFDLLETEADGLRALAAVAGRVGPVAGPAALVVPEPLALGRVDDRSVLLLPWLEMKGGSGSGRGDGWRLLGSALAALHRCSLEVGAVVGDRPDAFGWHRDNIIGATPQPNGWMDDWGRFFTERRLAPQLGWLAERGDGLRGADALLERVPGWLSGHGPQPTLVHGDLWSGNAALLQAGGATIFDPAVHRADREVDLAMARLFGGFPRPFFDGYMDHWPLPPGHADRVEIYNLYHLLNHANLFGGGYLRQAQASIDRLLTRSPR
jgi:fructosamine-3-kinase